MSNARIIDEIDRAIYAHGVWKVQLRTAIGKGSSTFTPEKVRCDDCCEFGKWLHGPTISPEMRQGLPHQVVTRLHREFHLAAAKVLEQAVTHHADDAKALFGGEFSERSEILVTVLNKWKRELQLEKAA